MACYRSALWLKKKTSNLTFIQIPSNVVRISRALVRHDFRGLPQIVYYQAGVGSGSSSIDKITGGLTGEGISEVSNPIKWFPLADNLD
jgi:hypothetical protein